MTTRIERIVTAGTFALDGGEWDVENNVWLIGDDEEVLVVDAAHDAGAIAAAVAGRRVVAIACTHAHNDHAGWVPALLNRFPELPVFASTATCDLLGTMWADSAKVMARKADEVAAGRVPVMAGATSNDTARAVDEARRMCRLGADFILSATPYYNKPSQDGLSRHFAMVADAADKPVCLYNVPGRTAVNLRPDTAVRLAQHPNIVAIKEASGSVDQTSAIRSRCDIAVLAGDDSIYLPLLAIGARGVVSVAGHLVPGELAEMHRHFRSGRIQEAEAIHRRLHPLFRALFLETNPAPVKHALERLGLTTGELRLPLVPVRAETGAAVERAFGRVDVLVNNAAVFATLRPRPFEEIPEAEWDRVMAVNVKGIWNCARAVVPVMRTQGGGRIVNVASAIVAKGTALLLHYVTSKGAVVAMTRALARELGPSGITVNAVAPGLILSEGVQANPDITGFQLSAVMQVRSLKRDAFPEDVEGAVVFLASDDSAFMSGQTLIVDGGSVFSTL